MFGLQLLNRHASASEAGDALARLRRRLPDLLCSATAETAIDDLPMDSMDVVEILCAIEDEFGVSLDSDAFMKARTVGDLSMAVAKRARRTGEK
jgi:acyl carrier protein